MTHSRGRVGLPFLAWVAAAALAAALVAAVWLNPTGQLDPVWLLPLDLVFLAVIGIALFRAALLPRQLVGPSSDAVVALDRQVAERDAHFRELVGDLGAIVWEQDPVTLGTRYISPAAETILGYPRAGWAAQPNLWMDLIRLDDREATIRVLRGAVDARGDFVHEHRAQAADGRTVWLRSSGHAVVGDDGHVERLRGVSVDVSDTKALEARLIQSQRLEAVGQLAGGIAHDFNNLLTAIRGYGEVLRRNLPDDDEQNRADLDQVVMAADRAAALTRQLLAFSRRQVLQPRVLEPTSIVEGIAPMLRRLLGELVELRTQLAPGVGRVKVDQGQLEQVIVNLAVNARDAMPKGGTLTIELANTELGARHVAARAEATPGRYVVLTVSDTGTGMDAETRAHVFEPFFTTKEPGQGTGLGLSTAYGIVKQSGGFIYLYSEPGHGTTFRIYLPRVDDPATASTAETSDVRPASPGDETILLVEDEPAVRGFARHVLEDAGYLVLEAATGADALALAGSYEGAIPLLVTDVMMPGMPGHELAHLLTVTRPDARVLFISGFSENAAIQLGVPDEGAAFLQKPFSADALAEGVRQVLDRQAR